MHAAAAHLVHLVALGDHLLSQLALQPAQHEGRQQAAHALDQPLLSHCVIGGALQQLLCTANII
jgi:hypothetical protein